MIKIDPRLVAISAKQHAARKAYDNYIKPFPNKRQWPMLTPAEQKEWYSNHGIN